MEQYSPATLGILLSGLQTFTDVAHKQEQYTTPSHIAAAMLYRARAQLYDADVIDLGCGCGILSIGCALLGARVTAFDSDADAVRICKENIAHIQSTLGFLLPITVQCIDVVDVRTADALFAGVRADVVVMNPPFGTKRAGIDVEFLRRACACADVVWTMHKTTTADFIVDVARRLGFRCSVQYAVDFSIPHTHRLHTKERKLIAVTVFCFERVS